jgi:formate dehydrogenase maturation protein FdhE
MAVNNGFETKRGLAGSIGATFGRIGDTFAQVGNSLTNPARDLYAWDDPEDVLPGGGEDNNRYDDVIRFVAKSLSFINKTLQAQKAKDLETRKTAAEQATQQESQNQTYTHNVNTAGTAENYFSRLMSVYGPDVQAAAPDVIAALNELDRLDDNQKGPMVQAIRDIGNQLVVVAGKEMRRFQAAMAATKG